jgi:formylglycine-generating enzyme required for sulfatase activity
LEVDYTAGAGSNNLSVVLPVGSQQCELTLGGYGAGIDGLQKIDGNNASDNPTTKPTSIRKSGQRHVLLMRVRLADDEAAIETWLDDTPHILWQGKHESLSLARSLRFVGPDQFALASSTTRVTYHSARFRLLAGDAYWLPVSVPPMPSDGNEGQAERLADAAVAMTFEKETMVKLGDTLCVQDLSGAGIRGLAQGAAYTPHGKVGGGLAVDQSGLRIPGGPLTNASEYTVTAWVRNTLAENFDLYCQFREGVTYAIHLRAWEPAVQVGAWNVHTKGNNWMHVITPGIPALLKQWCFVAVTYEEAEAGSGGLTIHVNDKSFEMPFQKVEYTSPKQYAIIGGGTVPTVGIIDEFAIFKRALSEEEIRTLYQMGLKGQSLSAEKGPGTALTPWQLPPDAPPPAIAPFDAATAKKHQDAWAEYLGAPVEQRVDLGDGVNLAMVLIPPGEFLMGSTAEEQARFSEEAHEAGDQSAVIRIPTEGPKHRVRITRPFYLGKYEVTQAQWEAVMGSNPSRFPGDPSRPVEQVSWNDVQPFVAKLNESSKAQRMKFGLPTEAQWEYACRAGTTTLWHCGDDEAKLQEYAWFNANSGGSTHPVGELLANAFGLSDTHGNVWEWCADWYATDYYAQSPPNDPSGRSAGLDRVFRGGSWPDYARHCRTAPRYYRPPGHRVDNLGFRLASVLVDARAESAARKTRAEKAKEAATLPPLPKGPVSRGKEGSSGENVPEVVTFSAPAQRDGLHPVSSVPDGYFSVEEIGDKQVIRPENYLCFQVDDLFAYDVPADAEKWLVVVLIVFDLAPGWIEVEYDGHPTGADSIVDDLASCYTRSTRYPTTGSGKPVAVAFKLPNARLANRQNGNCDFRVGSSGPQGAKPFALQEIRLYWATRK